MLFSFHKRSFQLKFQSFKELIQNLTKCSQKMQPITNSSNFLRNNGNNWKAKCLNESLLWLWLFWAQILVLAPSQFLEEIYGIYKNLHSTFLENVSGKKIDHFLLVLVQSIQQNFPCFSSKYLASIKQILGGPLLSKFWIWSEIVTSVRVRVPQMAMLRTCPIWPWLLNRI